MPNSHIGNLVISLPAVAALQNHFQSIPHYLVVDSAFKEIVAPLFAPEFTRYYPRARANQGGIFFRMLAYFKFLREIKAIQPDITIDLEGSSTSSIFTQVSCATHCLAGRNAARPDVYTVKAEPEKGKHKVQAYKAIAAAAGAAIDEQPFSYHPAAAMRLSVDKKLAEAGIDRERPIICIHAGAGRLQKLWTIEGYADVADWLAARGHQVLFVGGPAEAGRTEEILAKLQHRVFNFTGSLSLGELLALLEKCSVFLGNDSGPMHMADAMGTAVVALFSYADEHEWGPCSARSVVLRGQKPCDDCIKKKCEDPRCINTLGAEPVKRAVVSFLDRL
ncbi:MAG: glycosyltransferase family 9 protein [Deltaproteobacteria bacterium]|nr:glycosyltransferase family 9 protein [Deltaproteobacteria bacterium]